MNKQELIKYFEDLPYVSVSQMGKKSFIDMIEQLDEPQKPVVPQFVADWYEENKDDFETNLFRAVDLIPSYYEEGELSDFEEWLVDEHTKPFQTLVNMHQFGYEVEKEKRYLVKVKAFETSFSFLNLNKAHNHWLFSSKSECDIYQVYHTRKELEEAGLGWVFDCEGIEVKEVE